MRLAGRLLGVAVLASAAGCAPDLTIGGSSSGGAGGGSAGGGGIGGATSDGGGGTTTPATTTGGGAGGGAESGSVVWADALLVTDDDFPTGVVVDSKGLVRTSFDSVSLTASIVCAGLFEHIAEPPSVVDDVAFLLDGLGVSTSRAMAVDSQDFLVIAGALNGTTDDEVGSDTYAESQGGMDCLIAKAGLSFSWARALGGEGYSECVGVVIDDQDDIFVVGTFSGDMEADQVKLTSEGGEDIFVAKYSPFGTLLDAWTYGDTFRQRARAAGRDASGVIYVLGDDEGEGVAGGSDVLLLKLDPATGEQTVRRFGTASDEHARALQVQPDGGVAMTGTFYGTLDLGGGVLGHDSFSEARFVARFDARGEHVMSRGFYTSNTLDVASVVTDGAGNTFVGGTFYYAFDLAGETYWSEGGTTDGFVAKLGPGGDVLWVEEIESAQNEGIGAMTLAPNGHLIVTGYTGGTLIYGPWTLNGSSDVNHFVLEMVP